MTPVVVRGDRIGDHLLGLPLLLRLHAANGPESICGIMRAECAGLYSGTQIFSHIISLPAPRSFWESLRAHWQIPCLARRLDKLAPSVFLMPRWGDGEGYWAARLLHACAPLPSFAFAHHVHAPPRWGPIRLRPTYSTLIADDGLVKPEHDRAREFADRLQLPRVPNDDLIPLAPKALTEARPWLVAIGSRPAIAFGIGASSAFKRWPAERFAEVAVSLSAHHRGWHLVLVGAGPADAAAAAIIQKSAVDFIVHNVVDQLTLQGTMALLAKTRLVVGCDSAAVHMGAAVGVPALVIHWLPEVESRDGLLTRFLPSRCAGVLCPTPADAACHAGCVVQDRPHCILGVEVGRVVSSIRRALNAGTRLR